MQFRQPLHAPSDESVRAVENATPGGGGIISTQIVFRKGESHER
jgi:hypothetical protein